jgi:hypothetical protein
LLPEFNKFQCAFDSKVFKTKLEKFKKFTTDAYSSVFQNEKKTKRHFFEWQDMNELLEN